MSLHIKNTLRPILIAAAATLLAVPLAAQSTGKKPADPLRIPRTPDGHPDLHGTWTNVTLTSLERPAEFAGKPELTPAEAKSYEQTESADSIDGTTTGKLLANAGSAGTGAYNNLFFDRGTELATVNGRKRTALISDPPDGKVPPLTDAARARLGAMMRSFNTYDSVKDRPASERCLAGFGSTAGPPMLPVLYNNNYQIVQTPEAITILVEMIHDARIIRMNSKHLPGQITQWFGDSIGRWEGDTLIVETTGFHEQNRFRGASKDLKVTERFTRLAGNSILYRATLDDPATWARPWSVEFPFVATKGPVYEYACHEGNYAMEDILGGARKSEAEGSHK